MRGDMKKLDVWLGSLAISHEPNFMECVDYLSCYFPLLQKFETTQQDTIWHAEGHVATHTDLVLKSLYQILRKEAAHIQGEQRQSLILGALLHDIAKPITTTTQIINGIVRVVAPKHEEEGMNYVAFRLMQLPLSYSVVTHVMGLVGFHHLPKLLVLREQTSHAYMKLALNADLELLYWLEVADIRGRICSDPVQQLELLELFKWSAQSYDLWQIKQPEQQVMKQIQTQLHSISMYSKDYILAHAVHQWVHGEIDHPISAIGKNYEKSQEYAKLYIMCGISGSGKSNWIAHQEEKLTIISLDEIRQEVNGSRRSQKNIGRVLQLARQRLKVALAHKKHIVWDATNIRYDFRKQIIDTGLKYGALITLVVFHLDKKTIMRQNRQRKYALDDIVITDQMQRFQWPNKTEAHAMLIVGKDSKVISSYNCDT